MSALLLDTNMLSFLMADDPKVKGRLAQQIGNVATSSVALGEITYGIERLPSGQRKSNLKAKAGSVFATLTIEPITAAAGALYGKVRADLERNGFNFSDNDLWIAATCLSLGAVLVTNDHAFARVVGLSIDDWT